MLFSMMGAAVAGRQVWLQYLPPDQVPECGPGLEYMLEVYPLGETLAKILKGTGDCAEVDWTFLELSIAEWALISFIVLAAVSVLQLWKAGSK
jgi:disulfide bond formation protein DsbB